MYTENDPIISHMQPQAQKGLVSYHLMNRLRGGYSTRDITQVIVPAYWDLCMEVGIDPIMVIAQMCHETAFLSSWWSQRPRRNPAGIGVTGKRRSTKPTGGVWVYSTDKHVWLEGCSFTEWQSQSVPAHVGRLLAYAISDQDANDRQLQVIQHALTYRKLPEQYRGAARTWIRLNGRWAVPGTTYANRIIKVANALIVAQ